MSSVRTSSAVAVLALAIAGVQSVVAAPATTKAPVPVNLNENIVTIVLILGVAIAIPLVYVLTKLIPKMRRGEILLSKIEFDWRAELLNQTSKKEKARRAEEMARRDEERAAAGEELEFAEQGTQHYHSMEPLSPRDAAVPSAAANAKRVQVEVSSSIEKREGH
ncbi:hypothetical protein ABB37_03527 [Leptomonas pyrrhocoris]|uniref:Uncharacterized protein n=1 Tax=Leptomonas pyrrhocoris TaxID=157538 RepID=A0A0N0DX16_LEPPY|nr:hypothetical protein ABB37_03527 [Leptomonas pyrrhocoris]KPA82465.1 hypothetical protein ABB37_03527 [Leptomonas pyrrhocoris]|eukprot:XP_015660904.1 hypothetical protein ABB37_03527 [Leptomonas pyrrhocoris]